MKVPEAGRKHEPMESPPVGHEAEREPPQRVGVTGALGYVASHLLPKLRERATRIVAIVRPGRDAGRLEALGAEVRRADLEDPSTVGGVFADLDAVIHLSGMAQVPRFLPALEAAGVRRGVFVGSTGVHTRLESPGADAKRIGEAALRASGIGYVILRPTMIYGTLADRNLARLLRWLQRSPLVPVPGGGETPQQPVHVDDLVAAIQAALERPGSARREYDVGGPEPLSLSELIRTSAEALGRRAWIIPVPLAPSHRAVLTLRALRLPCPVRGEQVLRLAESKAVDIGPAQRDLSYRPRSFSEGIAEEAAALGPR
ncbi:MAG TPA: NAD(P)H-binding protein [Candidatus Limnocylindria bacterium]|nr:NAD(P)H-binding protein [Candidatus Limnocylindria bacterium]